MEPNTAKGVTDILGLGPPMKAGVEIVGRFLDRVFGPAADQAGQLLADPIEAFRLRRKQRATETVLMAAARVEARGHDAQGVPGRILFPILEQASLEEDDDLRARWAALLANSADPIAHDTVLPSFPNILKELTREELMVLDWLFRNPTGPPRNYEAAQVSLPPDIAAQQPPALPVEELIHYNQIYLSVCGFDSATAQVVDLNLQRLGLIARHRERKAVAVIYRAEVQALLAGKVGGFVAPDVLFARASVFDDTHLALTDLGKRFVKACS